MTSIDGYEMARKGRAGAALAVSAIGSFIAGTIGVIGLTLFAVPLASMALKFGPAEYFTLMLFAMTAVASLSGKSPAKGLLATILGLMIATIGIDLQSGQARYTMDIPEFQDGVGFIVVVVGLFAVAEVFRGMENIYKGTAPQVIRISGKLWLTKEEWQRFDRADLARRHHRLHHRRAAGSRRHDCLHPVLHDREAAVQAPGRIRKGAIEGVAGPEAANNSDTAGAMVPLLTLGVPGGGATAVMLGAFIMYGIQPGPLLFQNRPDIVWGLVDSMYIGNIMLLILNLPLIGLFVRLLYIPSGILYPLIVAISVIGTYAINGSMLDLYLILLFGVVGYIFDKIDIPVAPLVLSLVLEASWSSRSGRQ